MHQDQLLKLFFSRQLRLTFGLSRQRFLKSRLFQLRLGLVKILIKIVEIIETNQDCRDLSRFIKICGDLSRFLNIYQDILDFQTSVEGGQGKVFLKLGTLGDGSKSMTIRFDSNANVNNRCYRVTNANFAVGGRSCIGYSNYATDVSGQSVDGSR